MSNFSSYQDIAKNYNSSWRSTFGISGSTKVLEGSEIKNEAAKSAFFGNFTIKYHSGGSKATSPSENTREPSPVSIGADFKNAIEAEYGSSVAAKMESLYRLSECTQLSEKEISKIFTSAVKEGTSPTSPNNLNQGNWTTIKKVISKDTSSLQDSYTSTMVPTSNILETSYKADGLKGVCSRDYKNTKHSINAWSDKLETSAGRTLFSCVRSGVVTVLDPVKQEETFNNRLNENILTALHAQGKLPTEGNSKESPIKLSLVDIGLVSNYEWSLSEGKLQTHQFGLMSQAS